MPRPSLFMLGVLGTTLALAQPGGAQVVDHPDHCIIVPQARHVVWHPHPRPQPVIRVASVSADVSVSDQVATTTMVMVISNTGPGQQEAQVLVPVPDGASIRSFGVDSVGPEPTARLLPRDEARRIYNDIVAKMRDPGLLEFAGCGLIRSSVFPIPPGGTNTIRLTYEQLLPADGDRVDYVLPRTDSVEQSGVRWTLNLEIRSKRPISTVYSPSHEIVTERIDAGHVRVRAAAESASNPGSFRVSYLLQSLGKDGVSFSVVTYPDPEVGPDGGYFLLLAGLPAGKPAVAVKRELTVVIDRSGSMRGEKMEQAREALRQVVEGLDDGEYFNIIDYSDSIESFADRPVAKTAETIAKAREYIKSLRANGGTNIHDSLIEALRQEPTPGTLPVVLFLTDGLPTVGQTSEVAIRDAAKAANRAGRRVFTFGVGFDVNAPLLTGIARASRASSTFVLPEENVEVKVGQVYRRLSGPMLDTPKLSVAGAGEGVKPIRDLQPSVLPDLFEGDQLVVLGTYTDSAARQLVLQGNFLGAARTFEFQFDAAKASTRNSFVPRLWASRKIASLIEEIRLAGANGNVPGSPPPPPDPRTKELVDEIVRLSIKWGILTEYTAFLATEPGGAYTNAFGMRDELGRVAGITADSAVLGGIPVPSAPSGGDGWGAAPQIDLQSVLTTRAVGERAGKAAVNQEMNLSYQTAQTCENKGNAFWTKDMNKVQVMTVCQVADQTLFFRNNRWVDSRLLDKEADAPDATIEFASDGYFKLADELARLNRQGVLAQSGDVYLLHAGQRVLVKGPGIRE